MDLLLLLLDESLKTDPNVPLSTFVDFYVTLKDGFIGVRYIIKENGGGGVGEG